MKQTVAAYIAKTLESAYEGINSALELVRQTGNLPVPLHLRNAPTKLMKRPSAVFTVSTSV